MDILSTQTIVAISLAALATYSLRIGGLLLASRLPRTGRIRRGMNALPGALLFSLILPLIINEGIWGIVAAGATAIIALRTKNVFLAMAVGVGIIFAQRQLF